MAMDIKEFANLISGRQYGYPQFTKEQLQIAKDNGFVIVYGASDDLMEFAGAIEDEGNCFDGGEVYFDKNGVTENENDNCIEALWCDNDSKDENGEIITWTYETDIPHETFIIYDDDETYCRGIVFSINDLK